MSVLAVFIALGGVGYAAIKLPKNSVGTKQIKNGAVKASKIGNQAVGTASLSDAAVTGSKLAPNSVTGAAVEDGSLTAADIQTSTLPAPPGAFRSFSAVLGPNQTKSLTVGDFTFSETADGAGACGDVTLTTGAKTARVGVDHTLVAAVMANSTVTFLTAPAGSTTNPIATNDGSENVLATIAIVGTGANKCLTFGGVAALA
jgi:hypothetical protein